MVLSGNAVKKLGKRLRNNEPSPDDLLLLEHYRASFDPLLIETSLKIDEHLRTLGIPFLISGRSKRTKSIIRKLQRPNNAGMDLSRMSDIVGLRILVEQADEQATLYDNLCELLAIRKTDDYRNSPPETGYRSLHLITNDGPKLLEVQLRTLAQHLWATESESFGEKVKEGSGVGDAIEYLRELSRACIELDRGVQCTEAEFPAPFMEERQPITGRLSHRQHIFRQVSQTTGKDDASTSYVIVFDRLRGELLHDFAYCGNERIEAINEYRKYCKMVDESKMDVLILNSTSRIGIEVTHPQFF